VFKYVGKIASVKCVSIAEHGLILKMIAPIITEIRQQAFECFHGWGKVRTQMEYCLR
jgi:hypothetical protein